MNQESQMHFEGMEPNETGFHGETRYGDDIGDPDASGVDDTGLQDGRSDDTDADSGEQTTCGVDHMGLLDDLSNDVAPVSNEQTALSPEDNHLRDDLSDDSAADSNEQAGPSTDSIGPLDDLGDDAAANSSEQAARSVDDIDLQDEHGDHAAAAHSPQGYANNDGTSSGSVEEPDNEGTGSLGQTTGMVLTNDRRVIAMETPGWRYPFSHLVFDYRQMTDEEFSGLVEDIKEKGLQCPITRWRGEIIDGVHRLLACLEAGVEPVFEDLDDDADPEAHIVSKNDKRRHLTFGERAEAAAKRSARSKRGRPRLSDAEKSVNLRNKPASLTQEEAAKSVKISPKSVSHGVRVFSSDSSAIPSLQQAVREDKIAISDASRVVTEPPEIQQRAIDLVVSGESKTVMEGVGKARLESASRSKDTNADSLPYNSLVYDKDGARIYRSGAIDLMERVPPGSVDVVISAPAPQDASMDESLSHAAIFASHALTTEGLLVLAADSGRLQQQLARVRQRRLEWICQIHLFFESPISNTGEPHYIEQRIIPLLLFGKPGTRLDGGDDVMVVPPQREETKNEPQSIQHAADLVIGRFVKSGPVVCVPELSGGSYSLLMAAARAGCKIIAADDKPSRIKRLVRELSKLQTDSFTGDHAGA